MDKKILDQLNEYLDTLCYVPSSDIPGLSLYMDQVTGFMEERLSVMKREPSDKVLTKTMINNYAKNRLLPPPVKKRYSKNHILLLLLIYYYKGILSLSDISEVLKPLNEGYFDADSSPSLSQVYEEVFSLEADARERLLQDIGIKFKRASESFSDENDDFSELSEDDRDELQLFAFISQLAYDIYLKKQLIERLTDRLREKQPSDKSKRK